VHVYLVDFRVAKRARIDVGLAFIGTTIFCGPQYCKPSYRICCFAAEMSRAMEFSFFHGNCPFSGKSLQIGAFCIYLAVCTSNSQRKVISSSLVMLT